MLVCKVYKTPNEAFLNGRSPDFSYVESNCEFKDYNDRTKNFFFQQMPDELKKFIKGKASESYVPVPTFLGQGSSPFEIYLAAGYTNSSINFMPIVVPKLETGSLGIYYFFPPRYYHTYLLHRGIFPLYIVNASPPNPGIPFTYLRGPLFISTDPREDDPPMTQLVFINYYKRTDWHHQPFFGIGVRHEKAKEWIKWAKRLYSARNPMLDKVSFILYFVDINKRPPPEDFGATYKLLENISQTATNLSRAIDRPVIIIYSIRPNSQWPDKKVGVIVNYLSKLPNQKSWIIGIAPASFFWTSLTPHFPGGPFAGNLSSMAVMDNVLNDPSYDFDLIRKLWFYSFQYHTDYPNKQVRDDEMAEFMSKTVVGGFRPPIAYCHGTDPEKDFICLSPYMTYSFVVLNSLVSLPPKSYELKWKQPTLSFNPYAVYLPSAVYIRQPARIQPLGAPFVRAARAGSAVFNYDALAVMAATANLGAMGNKSGGYDLGRMIMYCSNPLIRIDPQRVYNFYVNQQGGGKTCANIVRTIYNRWRPPKQKDLCFNDLSEVKDYVPLEDLDKYPCTSSSSIRRTYYPCLWGGALLPITWYSGAGPMDPPVFGAHRGDAIAEEIATHCKNFFRGDGGEYCPFIREDAYCAVSLIMSYANNVYGMRVQPSAPTLWGSNPMGETAKRDTFANAFAYLVYKNYQQTGIISLAVSKARVDLAGETLVDGALMVGDTFDDYLGRYKYYYQHSSSWATGSGVRDFTMDNWPLFTAYERERIYASSSSGYSPRHP